ncbi:MAG TPA: methionine gamma-lyase family protein [Bacilli bacterium]
MPFSPELMKLAEDAEQLAADKFREIDRLIDKNQWKVIRAFQRHRVSDFHLQTSTGYGYNDKGRETLDLVFADVFGAEAAIVRPHLISGTHTIAAALFGVLRPGDELLYITGKPYDTLHKVIGQPNDGTGSLADWGVTFREVELREDGTVDWLRVKQALTPRTKLIGIQRSRGYSWRRSFSVAEIGEMVERVKTWRPDVLVFVDNCYGEFTEELEPPQVGADIIAGSLIKNPGGGIARTGGYIAGTKNAVKLSSYRLTVPGIGGEAGAMLGTTRDMFLGLFLSPHTVGQALKGAVFAAAMFEQCGFATNPKWNEARSDIIQAVKWRNEEQLLTFVRSIQQAAAVDSHVTPEPWEMPGYADPVIMAAGTFIQGGSLELSADAPVRAPYIAYMQGGLTYSHAKYGVLTAIANMFGSQQL